MNLNRAIKSWICLIFASAACLFTATSLDAAGTWTKLMNTNPLGGSGVMLLLTDGTVIIQGPDVSKQWVKLSPDSTGAYVSGTFSFIAPMSTERLFFGSNVLPSGQVFVMGGEYSGPNGDENLTNTGEIYDPVANAWTTIPAFPQPSFGGDPTIVLPNGKILCGYQFSPQTFLFDPSQSSWTVSGTKLHNDRSDDESWVILPGGRILSYDVFSSPTNGPGNSQSYDPVSATWADAGEVPVSLMGSAFGFELGPAGLLPDGRVLLVGGNNLTAFYTPASNSWKEGPTLPNGFGADAAPGAMLPNGHFLLLADKSSSSHVNPPTKVFDFDYLANTFTDVTPTSPTELATLFSSSHVFPFRMLVLPNGHVLVGHRDTSSLYEYAPDGAPQASWLPTIIGNPEVTETGDYLLKGTQLTGISEGVTYGDDIEASTNYPLIRLTSSTGIVKYARTTQWMPCVQTGALQTTVRFSLPSGVPAGTYQLQVVASGIASAPLSFEVTPPQSNVSFTSTGRSVTITGLITSPPSSKSITVTVQGGTMTVEGTNGTKVNGLPSDTKSFPPNTLVNVEMGPGDDSVTFVGLATPRATVKLGPGNDTATFLLSNVSALNIDGGKTPGSSEVNTLITTSSVIGTTTKTNF